MELKVWVDGIQRIVSGVNQSTTCHDIVLALAVATGQTGRFTLIEKYGPDERLLSPAERPTDVLKKWGGHCNDVEFVMKRSPPLIRSSNNCNNNNNQELAKSKSCSRVRFENQDIDNFESKKKSKSHQKLQFNETNTNYFNNNNNTNNHNHEAKDASSSSSGAALSLLTQATVKQSDQESRIESLPPSCFKGPLEQSSVIKEISPLISIPATVAINNTSTSSSSLLSSSSFGTSSITHPPPPPVHQHQAMSNGQTFHERRRNTSSNNTHPSYFTSHSSFSPAASSLTHKQQEQEKGSRTVQYHHHNDVTSDENGNCEKSTESCSSLAATINYESFHSIYGQRFISNSQLESKLNQESPTATQLHKSSRKCPANSSPHVDTNDKKNKNATPVIRTEAHENEKEEEHEEERKEKVGEEDEPRFVCRIEVPTKRKMDHETRIHSPPSLINEHCEVITPSRSKRSHEQKTNCFPVSGKQETGSKINGSRITSCGDVRTSFQTFLIHHDQSSLGTPFQSKTNSCFVNSRPRNPPAYNEAVKTRSKNNNNNSSSQIYSPKTVSSPSTPSPLPSTPSPNCTSRRRTNNNNNPSETSPKGNHQKVFSSNLNSKDSKAKDENEREEEESSSPIRPSRKCKVPKETTIQARIIASSPKPKETQTAILSSSSPSSSPRSLVPSGRGPDPLRLMSNKQRNALMEGEIVETIELHEPKLKESILMESKMKQMEDAWRENEVELAALEAEFKVKKEKDGKIKETNQLLQKSQSLDNDIRISKHKIQLLQDQIREEEHRAEMRARQNELGEEKKKKEKIEQLKNDIRVQEEKLANQKKELEQIESEMDEIDALIKSKTIQVDSMAQEIRKENVIGLSVEPSAQILLLSKQLNNNSIVAKLHTEQVHSSSTLGGFSPNSDNDLDQDNKSNNYFYNRIGSTRKMLAYPRQLQTAVATLKHPNGVWV